MCRVVVPVPLFERWLTELAEADEEIFGEVMALLNALETYGRDLDDESREESHPVVTSRYDLHALRRTPPTDSTPYAIAPPVLRILYAVCQTAAGPEIAVALLGGDNRHGPIRGLPPRTEKRHAPVHPEAM